MPDPIAAAVGATGMIAATRGIAEIPAPLAAAVATAPKALAERGPLPIRLATSISMEQAVKMAEQRYKARVVRAEAQHDAGHTVYVLRMLNESGRVWTVRVDASSGAMS